MRPGDGGVAAAVPKMNALPLFSRAEQMPFKIPVHVPANSDSDPHTQVPHKILDALQIPEDQTSQKSQH